MKRIVIFTCFFFLSFGLFAQDIYDLAEWLAFESEMRERARDSYFKNVTRIIALKDGGNVKEDTGRYRIEFYRDGDRYFGVVALLGYRYSSEISRVTLSYARRYFNLLYKYAGKDDTNTYDLWYTDDWYGLAYIYEKDRVVELQFWVEDL